MLNLFVNEYHIFSSLTAAPRNVNIYKITEERESKIPMTLKLRFETSTRSPKRGLNSSNCWRLAVTSQQRQVWEKKRILVLGISALWSQSIGTNFRFRNHVQRAGGDIWTAEMAQEMDNFDSDVCVPRGNRILDG